MPLTRPPLANPQLQRIDEVRQSFIDVRPIPQRATTATNQATLQAILSMSHRQGKEPAEDPTRKVRAKNAHGKRPSDKKKDDGGSSSKKRKH